MLKESNTHRNSTQRAQPIHTKTNENNTHPSGNPTLTNTNDNHMQPSSNLQPRSYVDVTRSRTTQVKDTTTILTKLIDEFKGLFNQLLQHNSMILKILTMLINKNN
jgi:hypothetical protein